MLKSYKYELRPTEEQKTSLNNSMGACRFVYNLALETKIAAYQSGVSYSMYELMRQLTQLRNEVKWLKECYCESLTQSLFDLDKAYKSFFKESGFPKFKTKLGRQSFRIPRPINVDFENWTVKIPKMAECSFNRDRKFTGQIRQATISRTLTGRYFISILVNTGVDKVQLNPVDEKTTVGIDLGIKHFAVISNGIKIDNPKNFFKAQRKLRIAQRILSRKKKGSKGRNRQRLVVAKIHEKIANKRHDFLHKLSTEIANQYDTICVENLNVAGMIKNKKLSKSISDVSWSSFITYLKYKADWYGKNVIQIGRFEPSSKTCSCGVVNDELTLKDREWTCNTCGVTHDRDLLAANNIKIFGLRTQPDIRQRKAIA